MPLTELRQAVRVNAFESALGLVVLLAGAGLNFGVEKPGALERFLGYVVSTCGTLLISWTLTRAWVLRTSNRELAHSLQGIIRILSTVASQLNRAVREAWSSGSSPIDSTFVDQCVQHLFGIISDLQVLTGSPMTVDEVVAIKTRLDKLGRELAAAEAIPVTDTIEGEKGSGRRLAEVAEEINSIRSLLESTTSKRVRQVLPEVAECPRCQAKVQLMLGSVPGDSAMPTCSNCEMRFHAHRNAQGDVFARPWGPGIGSSVIRIVCPSCQSQVPLTVPREGGGSQTRYCLKCFAKLQVEPQSHAVSMIREPEPPLVGAEVTDELVRCPICKQTRKTIASREGVLFAVCPIDDKLLRAERTESTAVPEAREPDLTA